MHVLPMRAGERQITALIFLFTAFSSTNGKPGYFLTTHNSIVPGSKHNVCITFTGLTSDATVRYEFIRLQGSAYGNIYAGGEETLSAEGGCKEFSMPLTLPTGAMKLVVEGYSTGDEADSYEFNGTITLQVLPSIDKFTLIQTDKPVYKPSQTVRIRIVTMLFNLSVVTTGVQTVSIKNPDGIVIEQWQGVTRSKGIVELSMKLADEPRLGTYTILCFAENQTEQTTFSVRQYVLPRVEVIHKPVEYLVYSADYIVGEVCARYTFSGGLTLPPLKGRLTATFTLVKAESDSSIRELVDKPFTVNDEINDCYAYNVSAKHFQIDRYLSIINATNILVKVNVTEHGTGVKTTASDALIKIVTTSADISIIGEDTYKPGLPYSFKVKLNYRSGQIYKDESVRVTVRNGVSRDTEQTEFTNEDGEAFFTEIPVSFFQDFTIQAKYIDSQSGDMAVARKQVTPWYSPSGRYLKLHAPNDGNALSCNEPTTVDFDYTTTSEGEGVDLIIQVVGTSNIVESKREHKSFVPAASSTLPQIQVFTESCARDANVSITTRAHRGSDSISLRVTSAMSPSAKLLVFYIAPDGEVVADEIDIHVKPCTKNNVMLSFSKSIVRPGTNVSLNISASAGSFCSYGVVDRSVDLLSNRKLLDLADILEKAHSRLPHNANWGSKISDYKIHKTQCQNQILSRNINAANALDLTDSRYAFLMGKTAVLTDLHIDTRKCFCRFNAVSSSGTVFNYAGEPEDDLLSYGNTYEPSVQVRDYFPETWLWNGVFISKPGWEIVAADAPHSMTSWRGNAMCVHKEHGFGISHAATLTTFQRFFMRVRLPYSVIRGETVYVVVKTYNYFPGCFTITVSIKESSQYETSGRPSAICLCDSQPNLTLLRLIPRTLGVINVTLTAQEITEDNGDVCPPNSNTSIIVGVRDTVVKPLLVEPEGKREESVQSAYVCGRTGEAPKKWTIQFTLPKDIVAGSARGSVSVVGDLLGNALSNIRRLIRLPVGCGEQTLSVFAPMVFAARYLEATGQLTPKLATAVTDFLTEGYQKQVKNLDVNTGSFSYYWSKTPSLWLTAFLVKCFTQTSRYLPFARYNIEASIQFIRRSQLSENCFSPVGAGIYARFAPSLQDIASEKLKTRVTAFVVIALLEAGVSPQDGTVVRAIACLETAVERDVYGLAMTAYAFSLHDVRSHRRSRVMKDLWKNAISSGSEILGTSGNTKHWIADPSQGINAPINIETTAYALLAILQEPEQTFIALPVVNWLIQRQNFHGGYASTQDTVIAIQALAAYAEATYLTTENTGVVVNISAAGFSRRFDVTRSNRLVVQSTDLSAVNPANLTYTISGGGCVVVQAKLVYNVMSVTRNSSYFQTLVKPYFKGNVAAADNCTQRLLQICTRYTGLDEESSLMAIIDIKMLSGWKPVNESLAALHLNKTLQLSRYENKPELLSLHFPEITREFRCLTFEIIRTEIIKNPQPGQVFTYEYYAPAHRHETTFTLDECPEDDDITPYSGPPSQCTDVVSQESCNEPDVPDANNDLCPRCVQPRRPSQLCRFKHVLKIRFQGQINNRITIYDDLKNKSAFRQPRPALLSIESNCLCSTREQDPRTNLIVAYNDDAVFRAGRMPALHLWNNDIYFFNTTTASGEQIAQAIRQCPNS